MDEIKKDDVIVTAFCFNCGGVVFAKLIPLRVACDPTAVCMECKSDDTEIISDRLGSEIEFLAETKKVKETEAARYLNLLVMLGYEVFMVNGMIGVRNVETGEAILYAPSNTSIPGGIL